MDQQEIYEQVTRRKEYKNFPEGFVRKVIRKNINKKEPVKEVRKSLHEASLMYAGVHSTEYAEEIWRFLKGKIPDRISVLDLGCGEFPAFLEIAEKYFKIDDYFAVDVRTDFSLPGKVKHFVDDLTEPVGKWLEGKYDLALMLNIVPVIEKIRKGSGKDLLDLVRKVCRFVLFSFPMHSLGGRKYIGRYWKKWCEDNVKGDVLTFPVGKEFSLLLKCE